MSQIEIHAEVRFKNARTKETFGKVLSIFTPPAEIKSKMDKKRRRAASLLEAIDLDGRAFLFGQGDAEITDIGELGTSGISFRIFGGVLGGAIFWEELYELFLLSKPRDVLAVECNSQTAEYTLYTFDGNNRSTYSENNRKWIRVLNATATDKTQLLKLARNTFLKKTPNRSTKPARIRTTKKANTKKTTARRQEFKDKRPVVSMLEGEYRKHRGIVFWNGVPIEDADDKSFAVLNWVWAKDKQTIFFRGEPADVDQKSFRVLNTCFAKDKNQVWCTEGVVDDVDAKSFEVLDEGRFVDPEVSHEYACGYARDKQNVYFYHMDFEQPFIAIGADKKSFQTLGYSYGRDKFHAFCDSRKIENSDPKSFEILPGNYSRDGNRVYYYIKAIKGADPKTFRVLISEERQPSFSFAADNEHVYYGSLSKGAAVSLEGADPATFRALDLDLGTDGSRHYQRGKRIRRLPEQYRSRRAGR